MPVRNWMLDTPLSFRSRDNLANPIQDDDEYAPRNMPAIGDLFDLFDVDTHHDRDRDVSEGHGDR
jgi:phospholipase C